MKVTFTYDEAVCIIIENNPQFIGYEIEIEPKVSAGTTSALTNKDVNYGWLDTIPEKWSNNDYSYEEEGKTKVQVEFRNCEVTTGRIIEFDWGVTGSGFDIIRYRFI